MQLQANILFIGSTLSVVLTTGTSQNWPLKLSSDYYQVYTMYLFEIESKVLLGNEGVINGENASLGMVS